MEFKRIYEKIHLLNQTLNDANEFDLMENKIDELNHRIDDSIKILQSSEENFNKTEIPDFSDVKKSLEELTSNSKEFQKIVDELEEKSIDGALEVLKSTLNRTENFLLKQNVYKNWTEIICSQNVSSISLPDLQNTTKWLNQNLDEVEELLNKFPDLNKEMCDEFGDPCNDKCGGAGCEKCGGVLCENGALTKSERALGNSLEAKRILSDLEKKSNKSLETFKKLSKNLPIVSLNITEESLEKLLNYDLVKNVNTTSLITNMTNYINFFNEIVNKIENRSNEALDVKLNVNSEELNEISEKINKTVLTFNEFDNKLPTAEDFEKLKKLENSSILLQNDTEIFLENLEETLEVLKEVKDLNKNNTKLIKDIKSNSTKIENNFKEITNLTDSYVGENVTTTLTQLDYRTTVVEKKRTEIDLNADILLKAVENLEKNQTNVDQDVKKLNEDLEDLKEFQKKLSVIERAEAFIKKYNELLLKIEESEKGM